MADNTLSPFDAAMSRYVSYGESPVVDTGEPALDMLAGYQSQISAAPVAGLRDQKAMSVEETAIAKALRIGSPEDAMRLAVASRYNNKISQNQLMQDMQTMSPGAFERTYGTEAARNRSQFLNDLSRTYDIEAMRRTEGELLRDTALSVATGAGNMVGSAATLGAQVGDAVLGSNMAPTVAGWNQAANELLQGFKSSRAQQQQALYGNRSALNSEDNQAQYQEDLANGMGGFEAGARMLGRGFKEGAATMWDSPGVMFDTVGEAIGSIGTIGKATQVIGKAQATKAIIKKLGANATKEAVAKELASEAGKKLVMSEAMKSVPKITAVTEGGSAINQAQQEILGMSEEDLLGSEDYRDLRRSGLSHDEAQIELASRAGNLAGLSGAFIGFLSGYMGRAFEAAPLKLSPKGKGLAAGATAYGKNIATETAEEIVQEGIANQFAANLGVRSVGIDKNLLEGVGEAAGAAAVSSALSTGAIQSPALAGSALSSAGSGIKSSFDAAVEAADKRSQAKFDETSPVGSKALDAAVAKTTELANRILANQPEANATEAVDVTPNQTKPQTVSETPSQPTLADRIMQDFIIPDEEAKTYVDGSGSVMEQKYQEQGKLTRADELKYYMDLFQGTKDDKTKLVLSTAIIGASDKISAQYSDENMNYVQSLPEDAQDRQVFISMINTLAPFQSSPVFAQAEKMVTEATEESLRGVLDFTDIDAGNLDTPTAKATLDALDVIGRYKPDTVSDEQYNMVLDQLSGSSDPKVQRRTKQIRNARDTANVIRQTKTAKSNITANQTKANDALPEQERKKNGNRLYRPKAEVGIDVFYRGNQEQKGKVKGKSAVQHRADVIRAFSQGKVEEGKAALIELGNFAQSQANKVGAYNMSADDGGQRKPFRAYSPELGWYMTKEQKDMPFANPKFTGSKALAQDVHVEATMLTDLYNNLRETYLEDMGELDGVLAEGPKTVPALNPVLLFDTQSNQTTANQATADQTRKQEYDALLVSDGLPTDEDLGDVTVPAERRLRKDAVLKSTESLIDDERSAVGNRIQAKQVTPKRTRESTNQTDQSKDKTVTRQKFITREDVKNNPEVLYVFGDNDRRAGFGGQAKAMRGEKNSIGIRTKKAPSNNTAAFYRDAEFEENIKKIDEDFAILFNSEKSVIIPEDGLGIGLAKLEEYAPKTLAHIEKRIAELESGKSMSKVTFGKGITQQSTPKQHNPHQSTSESQQAAEILNKSAGIGEVFSELGFDQEAEIAEAIHTIEKATGLQIMTRIKGMARITHQSYSGWADWGNGLLALNEAAIESLFSDRLGMHTLVHEIGHFIDNLSGEPISLKDGRLSSKDKGNLYQEIIQYVSNDSAGKIYFKYALGHRNDKVKSSELFAELFVFVMLNPELALEKLPNGARYIEEITGAVGATIPALQSQRERRRIPAGTSRSRGASVRRQPSDQTSTAQSQKTSGNSEKQTLTDWFLNLFKDTNGSNRFETAFKSTGKSDLLVQSDPAAFLIDKLDQDTWEGLTEDEAAALYPLLEKVLPDTVQAVQKAAQDYMASPFKDTTIGEFLKQSYAMLDFPQALTLNFLVEGEDGSMRLDDRVVQAAVLSALEWSLTAKQRNSRWLKDDDIHEIFNIPETVEITPYIRRVANSGAHVQSVIDDVQRRTMRMLGVSPDRSQPSNQTQGLFKALASNVLEAMLTPAGKNVGSLLNREAAKYAIGPNEKTDTREIVTISLGKSASLNAIVDALKAQPDVFTEAFVEVKEPTRYIGTPPAAAPRTKQKNKLDATSAKERKAIEFKQKIVHKLNMPMDALLGSLGRQNALLLQGWKDLSGLALNETHAESLTGKNKSLEYGMDALDGWIASMQKYTRDAEEPLDLEDVEVFFDYQVSKTGRMFQQGPGTPQANKLIRELLTATNSVLDLNQQENVDLVWLGVAQAAGISIEKKADHETSIKEAQDMFADPEQLKPALDVLKGWVQNGMVEMSEADQQTLIDTLNKDGIENSMKLVHALVTVARMETAGANERAAFETSLAIEADGVTDGPGNAMVHMGTGTDGFLTEQDIENFAKVGLFFTNEPMSLNEYKQQDSVDLYKAAAQRFEDILSARLVTNPDPNASRVVRIMSALLPKFVWSDDTKEVDRNVTKNPLTVFMYGSGEGGIGGKITGAALDFFYETLSEIAQQLQSGELTSWQEHTLFIDNPSLVEDLNAVMGIDLGKMLADPVKLSIRGNAYLALTGAVTEHFAEPMIEAIDQTTGGLRKNMQLLQKASQIQAVLFQDAFEKAYDAKLKQLKADKVLIGQQRMSEKDMLTVFEEAMALAPIYKTGSQSFHIVGSEQYESSSPAISGSFTGKLTSAMFKTAPGDAGVKASPYLTIGTGDGRMVLNIYVGEDGSVSTSLPVFDGIELSLDKTKAGSEYINKTVFESWMEGNNFQSVLDSYEETLRTFKDRRNLSKTSVEALKRIFAKDLDPNTGDVRGYRPNVTMSDLLAVRNQLKNKAQQNQARKNAFKRLGISVDHMAGAMSPYVHKGLITISDVTGKPDLVFINSIIKEELDKLKAKDAAKDKEPAVQPATEGLLKLIESEGTFHEDSGLYTILGAKIADFFKKEKQSLSSEHKALFWKLLNQDGAHKDTLFYFGSSEALTYKREEIAPGMGNKPVEAGQYLPALNVALIANASPETILHEVLHVSTVRRLVDHYLEPGNSRTHVREAVQRLEGLLKEFEALNLSAESWNVQAAAQALKDTLKAIRTTPNQSDSKQNAAILSEFISWTLTNQHLIDLGKKTGTYSGLQKVKAKVLHMLKKFLGLSFYKGDDLFSNIRFNTEILIREIDQAALSQEDAQVQMLFDQVYPASNDLQALEDGFVSKLNLFLGSRHTQAQQTGEELRVEKQAAELTQAAQEASERVIAAGYPMNDRELSAFRSIHAALQSGMQIDPLLAEEMEKTYRAAVEQLGDISLFDGTRKDAVTTFFAMSQVQEDFRKELSDLKSTEKSRTNPEDTKVDLWIKKQMGRAGDLLIRSVDKDLRRDRSLAEKLDALSGAIIAEKQERRSWANRVAPKAIGSFTDKADEIGAKAIQKGAKTVSTKLAGKAQKSGLAAGVKYLADAVNVETADAAAESMLSLVNKSDGWFTLRRVMTDLIGTTASTENLVALINKVKSGIDEMRQKYREIVPKAFEEGFSRKLKKEEWETLSQGIAQIDLSAMGVSAGMALLKNPQSVGSLIKGLETRIDKIAHSDPDLYIRKAKELAEYMIKKETSSDNLLKNAEAIAAALNESVAERTPVTNEFRDNIDKLSTLYAFQMLDQSTKDALQELASNEEAGTKQLVGYYHSTKLISRKQQGNSEEAMVARYNAWKGYMPELAPEGHDIVLVDEAHSQWYKAMGYVRIGDYTPDDAEHFTGKMGVWKTSVGGAGLFNQGIAQTVHKSHMGADSRNGASKTAYTGDAIYGAEAKLITKRKAKGQVSGGTKLIPIFNKHGQVIGYNRQVPAKYSSLIQRNKQMHEMMGVWSGRLFEEQMAQRVNSDLLKALKSMYDDRKMDEDFANVADHKDPVIRDAWEALGKDIKEEAAALFGKDFVPVRKDLIDDVIGFRAASLVDPFTGVTRWHPDVTKTAFKLSRMIMGDNAYRNLRYADTGIRSAVSLMKTNIVIRSMVVPFGNIVSNVLQLRLSGVPLNEILKVGAKKIVELNTYVRNRDQIMRKTVELASMNTQTDAAKRLKAQISSMERENRKLSIQPLLEAGEFNTISEGLTEADQALMDGKFGDLIERLTDRLPDTVKVATKNLLITKDTELFKALNRSVQYGDFIAKAILYDHLINEKKLTVKEAVSNVSEKQNFSERINQVVESRLTTASDKRVASTDAELVSEMGDAAILLQLLNVEHNTDEVLEAPSEKELLTAQKRLLELYDKIKNDPKKAAQSTSEIGKLMSWFTSPVQENKDRMDRAKKHAHKYGNGNLEAHYIIQLIEELGEVLQERDRIVGKSDETVSQDLEIQKRALKVLRFGADTVNKGAGAYQGKTNLEAFNMALGNTAENKLVTKSRPYTSKEALREISEEFVNYNRSAGRGRDAAESFGMLWFWNFKLRIMKVAWNRARKNPFGSLVFGAGFGPMMDIDTIFSGSLAGAFMDDRLGYSIGYDMGVNGLTANPFMSLVK